MLNRLPRILWPTEQQGVGTGRSPHGQLVQSQNLTTGLLDPGPGGVCDPESSDGELGDCEEAVVVGDGPDDDDGLVLVLVSGAFVLCDGYDAGNGDGGSVDAGHEETAEDDLVEV